MKFLLQKFCKVYSSRQRSRYPHRTLNLPFNFVELSDEVLTQKNEQENVELYSKSISCYLLK